MSRAPYPGGVTTPSRDRFDGCEELAGPIPDRYGAAAASPVARATTPQGLPDRPERRRGGRPPLGAPAEGYGPRFPRVGAVAAPTRPRARSPVPPDTMTV